MVILGLKKIANPLLSSRLCWCCHQQTVSYNAILNQTRRIRSEFNLLGRKLKKAHLHDIPLVAVLYLPYQVDMIRHYNVAIDDNTPFLL